MQKSTSNFPINGKFDEIGVKLHLPKQKSLLTYGTHCVSGTGFLNENLITLFTQYAYYSLTVVIRLNFFIKKRESRKLGKWKLKIILN